MRQILIFYKERQNSRWQEENGLNDFGRHQQGRDDELD